MNRRLLVLVGCIAAVLVAALPATANNKPTTGTRINLLFQPPATFAANSPFFIEHGFLCGAPGPDLDAACLSANSHFDLYLDGALQPSTVDIDLLQGPPMALEKRNLTNYPAGLPAGSHTFVGVFIDNGTVVLTLTVTITFT